MAKTRVATRVKAAVGGKKSHNLSEDLVNLTEKYNVFVKRLQGLIAALKEHFGAMQRIAKTRFTVAQHLAVLSKDSPLFDKTGARPNTEGSSEATVASYLSIQEGVAGKAKMYNQKFAQFVIDYAVEWEKVVTSRVNKGLKNAEQLRVELDHYQSKVEALRQTANATMAKGKQVDQKAAEKLTRNEDKLVKIRESYNSFVRNLCILIDEVTDRSWRDLHPLLIKIAQFEVTLSGDEAQALSSLNGIVNELKQLAVTHGIKPQARLKDLDSLDPAMLSTKAPGSQTLTIEAGLGGLSFGGDTVSPNSTGGYPSPINDTFAPPGTLSPQGTGGFPVSVNSADAFSTDTRSYDGSNQSSSTFGAPSTLDRMAINKSAAPPPTVDDLTAAFGPSATPSMMSTQSAPVSSSAMIPLTTSGGYGGGSFQRKQSYDSFDSSFSGVSGASAPPPAAPPPPPPSQFGTMGAANSNPFGLPPPAPSPYGSNNNHFGGPPAASPYGATSYGAPNPYGAPATSPSYASASPTAYYGNSTPSPFGQPPPLPQGYGQQPPPQYNYSQPSPSSFNQGGTNPFE